MKNIGKRISNFLSALVPPPGAPLEGIIFVWGFVLFMLFVLYVVVKTVVNMFRDLFKSEKKMSGMPSTIGPPTTLYNRIRRRNEKMQKIRQRKLRNFKEDESGWD